MVAHEDISADNTLDVASFDEPCASGAGESVDTSADSVATFMSLREWIATCGSTGDVTTPLNDKWFLVKKTAVAYGVAELLTHISETGCGLYGQQRFSDPIFDAIRGIQGIRESLSLADDCHVDNFVVRVSNKEANSVVDAVSCVSPSAMKLLGNAVARQPIPSRSPVKMSEKDSDELLSRFGQLLFKLYMGNPAAEVEIRSNKATLQNLKVVNDEESEPVQKRRTDFNASSSSNSSNLAVGTQCDEQYTQLKTAGVPESLSTLVRDLLEAGNRYVIKWKC